MKRERYLTILLVMCMMSYFMMVNLSMTAVAEDISSYNVDSKALFIRDSFINDIKNELIKEKKLIEYISSISNLSYDDSEFIYRECKTKNIDPFIVLGLIKRESDFNPKAVGAAGERGLGQLMENTARPVAENLGYIYNPDKLFDTRYNLKLTITQMSYLLNVYKNDIHKALTAYNRGQQGLEYYMEGNENNNPAVSDYSAKVLQFAKEYKDSFSLEVR